MALNVRAFASNDDVFVRKGEVTMFDAFFLDAEVADETKDALFEAADCRSASGVSDLLLNGLSGRYLWISVEVLGEGEACLWDFR